MAYIVLSFVGIAALLLIREKWQTKKKFIFVGTAIVIGALLYIIVDVFILPPPEGITKGDSNFLSKIPWLDIGLYVTMLLGMASKHIYDAIGKKNRKKIKFNKWQFIRSFLVSPIIFAVVYSRVPEATPLFPLLIFSYQNGFFWHTILFKVATDS